MKGDTKLENIILILCSSFIPEFRQATQLGVNPVNSFKWGTCQLRWMSPSAFYVGVSSLEVLLPAGQCCTFRGSLVKLDIRNGKILWQTYTLPDNGGKLGGYLGAVIWGSSPSIDIFRGLVYVSTGNLYLAPVNVLRSWATQNNRTTPPSQPDQCFGTDQLGGYDVFYFACLAPNNPDCLPGPNLDADFGEAPMLLSIRWRKRMCVVVVVVQKSGFAWALDCDNGDIKAGPGSLEGGGVWGAATDGVRVYINIVNGDTLPFTLQPSTRTTTAGGWVALDANTGEILWTTANPSNDTANGPVTIVNGVLFAGSVAPSGPVYAMDARNGAILWSINTGATVYGGASASYAGPTGDKTCVSTQVMGTQGNAAPEYVATGS
ncbi:Polyvinylalcohol dehydrogenase [Forsythia ovata]|uniref:Polyvinylalcohol dehydrogenase n=1 Tax=Forsythia ovata TaxID=205694 RepID=A0ABD1WB23_9LAMI